MKFFSGHLQPREKGVGADLGVRTGTDTHQIYQRKELSICAGIWESSHGLDSIGETVKWDHRQLRRRSP